jgi:hypothetical protein
LIARVPDEGRESGILYTSLPRSRIGTDAMRLLEHCAVLYGQPDLKDIGVRGVCQEIAFPRFLRYHDDRSERTMKFRAEFCIFCFILLINGFCGAETLRFRIARGRNIR